MSIIGEKIDLKISSSFFSFLHHGSHIKLVPAIEDLGDNSIHDISPTATDYYRTNGQMCPDKKQIFKIISQDWPF